MTPIDPCTQNTQSSWRDSQKCKVWKAGIRSPGSHCGLQRLNHKAMFSKLYTKVPILPLINVRCGWFPCLPEGGGSRDWFLWEPTQTMSGFGNALHMNPNYLDWESNRPAGTHGNVQLMQKQPATVADLDQKKFKRMFFQDILPLMQRSGWQVCRQVPWVSLWAC